MHVSVKIQHEMPISSQFALLLKVRVFFVLGLVIRIRVRNRIRICLFTPFRR